MHTRRATRRDEILVYICRYCKDNPGVTPSVRAIAEAVGLHRNTVSVHVTKLIAEDRLAWVDGRLCVIDSEWIEPPYINL